MREKPSPLFSILGAFPSDRIPKVTKDVNAQFFIYSFTDISLIQQFLKIMLANSENYMKLFLCVVERAF